jgi:hypothetical protein
MNHLLRAPQEKKTFLRYQRGFIVLHLCRLENMDYQRDLHHHLGYTLQIINQADQQSLTRIRAQSSPTRNHSH